MKVYLNDNSVCIKPESKIEDIAIRENEESLRKLFYELVEETKKAQRSH